MALIFDIETVGCDLIDLCDSQQEFLLRYAVKEKDERLKYEKIDETERFLSLYPYTAKLVAVGMLNTETEGSFILYEGEDEEWKVEAKKIKYKAHTEKLILENFWDFVKKTDRVITFNGRSFDLPFLMVRSAMLNVKPTMNLIQNRFNTTHHIDLLDQFTFYGLTKKFNLDFYCRAFNIPSPKSKGVSGMEVKELYNAGRRKDIAIYCGEDVYATYQLYKIWNEYLNL